MNFKSVFTHGKLVLKLRRDTSKNTGIIEQCYIIRLSMDIGFHELFKLSWINDNTSPKNMWNRNGYHWSPSPKQGNTCNSSFWHRPIFQYALRMCYPFMWRRSRPFIKQAKKQGEYYYNTAMSNMINDIALESNAYEALDSNRFQSM